MILHPDSYTDHVPADVLAYIVERFADRNHAFVESFLMPPIYGPFPCSLYGPAMSDQPIPEEVVRYGKRSGRDWESRLINRPPRPTGVLTVVAGPYGGNPCVLYTVYSGPFAPKEPTDPSTDPSLELMQSLAFWSQHALACS